MNAFLAPSLIMDYSFRFYMGSAAPMTYERRGERRERREN
jgi:hypothetical protein